MTYGFQVSNVEGLYQIKDDRYNYSQHSTGVVPSGTLVSDVKSLLSYPTDLLFLTPEAGTGFLSIYPNSSVSSSGFEYTCSSGGIRYSIMRLDSNRPLSNEEWGIRVFNSYGQLTADSGYRLLNPIANGVVPVDGESILNLQNLPIYKKRYVESSVLRPLGLVWEPQLDTGYYVVPVIDFETTTTIKANRALAIGTVTDDTHPIQDTPFFIADV